MAASMKLLINYFKCFEIFGILKTNIINEWGSIEKTAKNFDLNF